MEVKLKVNNFYQYMSLLHNLPGFFTDKKKQQFGDNGNSLTGE